VRMSGTEAEGGRFVPVLGFPASGAGTNRVAGTVYGIRKAICRRGFGEGRRLLPVPRSNTLSPPAVPRSLSIVHDLRLVPHIGVVR
jgi:hypothetical protein